MEEKIFVVCAPGLEAITAQEVRALELLPKNATPAGRHGGKKTGDEDYSGGGVEIILNDIAEYKKSAHSRLTAIYRLNLSLRTASRVLVRLGEFYAAAFSELRKKAGRLEWEKYLSPDQPVALRVTCHKSRLYHSGAVMERVLGAMGDRMGSPVQLASFDENDPGSLPQLVVVRIVQDQVTISIDTSGEHLHRRGYRLASAKAPLRETLAAGMLLASGWDRRSPLLDPFCGSGTIPIEAALMADDLAPGRQRRFAFMGWPDFDQSLWKQLLNGERKTIAKVLHSDYPGAAIDPPAVIFGSDRDAGAIAMSDANAARAGVSASIQFSCRTVSAVEPPAGPGWVVANPPYGLRVSHQKDLRNLYAQFGNVLRSKCPGWRFAVLCSDVRIFSHCGLHSDTQFSFDNGGVPVKLYCGTVST